MFVRVALKNRVQLTRTVAPEPRFSTPEPDMFLQFKSFRKIVGRNGLENKQSEEESFEVLKGGSKLSE